MRVLITEKNTEEEEKKKKKKTDGFAIGHVLRDIDSLLKTYRHEPLRCFPALSLLLKQHHPETL